MSEYRQFVTLFKSSKFPFLDIRRTSTPMAHFLHDKSVRTDCLLTGPGVELTGKSEREALAISATALQATLIV